MRSVPSHKRGKMKKFAFTLAEVLITLGIIGIVAALTLPNLIANHRAKELEAGLKKSSFVIQQALEMANAENGEPVTPESVNCFKFKHILVPYLKVCQIRKPVHLEARQLQHIKRITNIQMRLIAR